jgi:hypothetical protein
LGVLGVDEKKTMGQNGGTMLKNLLEKRKNTRYRTLARARLPGIVDGEVLLKDLNITGCCIETTMYIDIQPNKQCKINIFPEDVANIGEFELLVESRWTQTRGYSCESGFAVLESPKGKPFQRYVDYLSWRSSGGNTAV